MTTLSDFYDEDEELDFDDQFSSVNGDWVNIPTQIEDILVQKSPVQSVPQFETQPQDEQLHAFLILDSTGPEFEQVRSALDYSEKELAWDLYHYQKVNLELMQRKEVSVQAASSVLATAIHKSINERLSQCHDLYCLVRWLDGNIDDNVDLLALDKMYGHRTKACEHLIQRLGRVLTEQELNKATNKESIELELSVLDGLLQRSGTPKTTFEALKERSEDDSPPEPMPEWLNDLMISYSAEAKDLATSILQAEKDWTQDSMYKTLKLATTQSPYSPYHPKECHVHAVLFEVRRGIHHEQ